MYSSTLLDLGTNWSSASNPGRLTSGEIVYGAHCIEGWVSLGPSLDTMEKTSFPSRKSNHGRPARLYTD
jgi:hypothetical protein